MQKASKKLKNCWAKFLFGILLCLSLCFFSKETVPLLLAEESIPSDIGDTVNLRFILTSDLHGNISSSTTEKGVEFKNSGLAKAYDLILKAREEVGNTNALTFDAGDVLYDVSTRYVYEQNPRALQPIYKAMSLVGYDAITLGNHDFDFGYEYIKDQLQLSGLQDSVIVSNLKEVNSGEYPYAKNKLFVREMVTKNGNSVNLKIGVVGLTVPVLSKKTELLTGKLKTEDMITATEREAAELKAQGADIIIVLAHSGFGEELPEKMATNTVYALSKLEDVDVILCGHEHKVYPDPDKNSSFYSLPGVDKETGLVNGKLVMMPGAYGNHIGISDIELAVEEMTNSFSIVKQTSQIRSLSKYETVERKEIKDCFTPWEAAFQEYRLNSLFHLAEGQVIENYFGVMQDSAAMQLINDSKRYYAYKTIHNTKKQYAKYPVIAASSYTAYGADSSDDYVSITNNIYQSDLVSLQSYRQFTKLYTITGAQLREWLEYSASAYETKGKASSWSENDTAMWMAMQRVSKTPLLQKQWDEDWSRFYCFEGIEYTIDFSTSPRYNYKGTKIGSSTRITSLTYEGNPVPDDMIFVVATNTLKKMGNLFQWADTQLIGAKMRSQTVLTDYLELLKAMGLNKIQPDFNWRVNFPSQYKFIFSTTNLSFDIAKNSPWYLSTLKAADGFYYYYVLADRLNETEQKPDVFAIPDTTEHTKNKLEIFVQTTASSGIKTLKYYAGDQGEESTIWQTAGEIQNGSFTAYKNGIYSIFIEDEKGNKNVRKFNISNIGGDTTMKPVINVFTNRKSEIEGRAEADCMVYLEAAGQTYETKVWPDGKFTFEIPYQKAGSILTLYSMDLEKNRKSDKLEYMVKRTGPNDTKVDAFGNMSANLTGNLNDDYVWPFVIAGKNVYVDKNGGKDIFIASDLYKKDAYVIYEVDVSIKTNGDFSMALPAQKAGTKLRVFTMDAASRKGKDQNLVTSNQGIDAPEIFPVYHTDKRISGKVSATEDYSKVTVYVKADKEEIMVVPDAEGIFSAQVSQVSVGESIEVYVIDQNSTGIQRSLAAKRQVQDLEDARYKEEITVNEFSSDDRNLSGFYEPNQELYLSTPVQQGNILRTINTGSTGNFSCDLNENLIYGQSIYLYTKGKLGEILGFAKVEIEYPTPEEPYLYEDFTNQMSAVQLVTDAYSKVYLKVGEYEFISEQGVYDEGLEDYVHTFFLEPLPAGTLLEAYAQNENATSELFTFKVIKSVPEKLILNEVLSGADRITGKTEIFAGPEGNPEEVKVFVLLFGKKFEAELQENGKFELELTKKQKNQLVLGTVISVFVENRYGSSKVVSTEIIN